MAPAAMKEWTLSYSVEARTGDWQPEPGQNADLVLVRVSGATHAVLALNLARSLQLSWSQSSEKISSLAQSRNSGSSGNVSVTI